MKIPELVVIWGALLAMESCSSPAPTMPTSQNPSAATPQVPPSPAAVSISGYVRDEDGMPVEGAAIASTPLVSSALATTSASGFYEGTASGRGGEIFILKSGYEQMLRFVSLNNGANSIDFHVYKIRRLGSGESLHATLMPDDSLCGLDDEFVCRRIRVVPAMGGTLTISVIPDDASSKSLGLAVGLPTYPYTATATRTMSVTAGAEILVDVLAVWTIATPVAFTFTSSLVP